jgi:acetyltransferase-like isoleucine patch superfamily enzyme
MRGLLKNIPIMKNLYQRYLVGIPFNLYTKTISGLNNQVRVNANIIWRLSIHINGLNNTVTIANAKLIRNLHIEIIGDNNNIYIGNDCQIKKGVVWIEGDSNICMIGSQTTIESAELYLTEKYTKIEIGNDCMLADSIVFRTGDSHSILDMQTNRVLNRAGNIVIGDHVWIGQGVTLLKNSVVQNGTVIGTRSLVNKSFEDTNIILAGVPAKIVMSEIRWVRERLIE